jgi:hypothetical protein
MQPSRIRHTLPTVLPPLPISYIPLPYMPPRNSLSMMPLLSLLLESSSSLLHAAPPLQKTKTFYPSAFHSRYHFSDGIMGIMETLVCRGSAVRDPCHETLPDYSWHPQHLSALSTLYHRSPDTISRCSGIPRLLDWEIAPPQTSSSDCPPSAPPPDRHLRSSITSPS